MLMSRGLHNHTENTITVNCISRACCKRRNVEWSGTTDIKSMCRLCAGVFW